MNPTIINYRISHWLYYHHCKHLSRIMDWTGRLLYSSFVPGQAQIGRNFKLAYWGLGVVVHVRAKIGDNCKLGQDVTIGGKGPGVPVLMDNVYVGGSFVVGGITLGNNVIVGANSFVDKDVPDNAIVAGSPAKIIRFRE